MDCCVCYEISKTILTCKCQKSVCLECVLTYKKLNCPDCDCSFPDSEIKPFFDQLKNLYISDFISNIYQFEENSNIEILEIVQKENFEYEILRNIPIDDEYEIVRNYNCKNCLNIVDGFKKTCISCGLKICTKCEEEEHENECNKEILKDVMYKRETSEPCPTCYTYITKSQGCDHMFCINCGTSFDWQTKKLTENVHRELNIHRVNPNSELNKRYVEKYNKLFSKLSIGEEHKDIFMELDVNCYISWLPINRFHSRELEKHLELKLKYLQFIRNEKKKYPDKTQIGLTLEYDEEEKETLYRNLKGLQYYTKVFVEKEIYLKNNTDYKYRFLNDRGVIEEYTIIKKNNILPLTKKRFMDIIDKIEKENIFPDTIKIKSNSDKTCIHFENKNFLEKITSHNPSQEIPEIKEEEIYYYNNLFKIQNEKKFYIDDSDNNIMSKEILMRYVKEAKKENLIIVVDENFEEWEHLVNKYSDKTPLNVLLIKNSFYKNPFCCDFDNDLFDNSIKMTETFKNVYLNNTIIVLNNSNSFSEHCYNWVSLMYLENNANLHFINTKSVTSFEKIILKDEKICFNIELISKLKYIGKERYQKILDICPKELKNITICKLTKIFDKFIRPYLNYTINTKKIMYSQKFIELGGTLEFFNSGEDCVFVEIGNTIVLKNELEKKLVDEIDRVILFCIYVYKHLYIDLEDEIHIEKKAGYLLFDLPFIFHFEARSAYSYTLNMIYGFIANKHTFDIKLDYNKISKFIHLVCDVDDGIEKKILTNSNLDFVYTKNGFKKHKLSLTQKFLTKKEIAIPTNLFLGKTVDYIIELMTVKDMKIVIFSQISEIEVYVKKLETVLETKVGILCDNKIKLYNEFMSNSSEVRIIVVDFLKYKESIFPLYDTTGQNPRFVFYTFMKKNNNFQKCINHFCTPYSKSKTQFCLLHMYQKNGVKKEDVRNVEESLKKQFPDVPYYYFHKVK